MINGSFIKCGILAGCMIISGCNSTSSDETGDSVANTTPSNESSSSSNDSDNSDSNSSNRLVISARHPSENATRIASTTTLTLEFNKAILAESFNDQFITLSYGNKQVAGTLAHNVNRLTFTPSAPLPLNTQFTVNIDGNIMSQDGLSGSPLSWQFTTAGDMGTTPQTATACMDDRDIRMLESVNKARSQSRTCGGDMMPATTPLRWNCLVEEAAQIHSDDMANNNFFEHSGSDGSNTGDRLDRVGYNYRGWGENIAAGQRDVATVMQGWLDSPGHCRNLMSARHQEFGLGYALNNNADYTHYWTQKFASPQ